MNRSENEFENDNNFSNAELVNNDSFLRLRSKNRRKEILRRIFYLTVGLILTVIITLVCIAAFFGLKSVEINGNSKYTEEQILEACGFSSSDNLFTLDLKFAEEAIIKSCPYISDVSFKRILPSTLIITVTEDAPSYCTGIYGDYFLLSEDLRVISRHDIYEDIEILSIPVIYLKLPEVDRAVTGERIVFDKSSTYDHLISFLSEFKKQEFYGRADCIDAQDRYHIALYTDDCKFKIDIGTSESLDTKLRFVSKVIEEEFTDYSIASINVEKVNQIVVRELDEPFVYR